MPLVKASDGTVIECATHELAGVLEALRQVRVGGNGQAGSNAGAASVAVSPLTTSENTVVWTEQRARTLWNWFYGDQKKLVDLLMEKDMTSDQIQKALKINGHVLSGLLSCITRNAKRETRYKEARVIDWKPTAGGGLYYILPEVKDWFQRVRS